MFFCLVNIIYIMYKITYNNDIHQTNLVWRLAVSSGEFSIPVGQFVGNHSDWLFRFTESAGQHMFTLLPLLVRIIIASQSDT